MFSNGPPKQRNERNAAAKFAENEKSFLEAAAAANNGPRAKSTQAVLDFLERESDDEEEKTKGMDADQETFAMPEDLWATGLPSEEEMFRFLQERQKVKASNNQKGTERPHLENATVDDATKAENKSTETRVGRRQSKLKEERQAKELRELEIERMNAERKAAASSFLTLFATR